MCRRYGQFIWPTMATLCISMQLQYLRRSYSNRHASDPFGHATCLTPADISGGIKGLAALALGRDTPHPVTLWFITPLRPHCRKHPYSQIFPRFVCSKFPSVFLQTALPAVWLWMYDSCAASPSSCSRGKAFSGAMQIRNTTPSLWLLRPGEPAGRLYRIRNWRREC